jgi:hypothetical protein
MKCNSPRRAQRRSVRVAAVAVAAVLAAGCGARTGSATSEPQGSWVDLALGDGDPLYIDRLTQDKIAQCMADRGWPYKPLAIPDVVRRVDDRADRERRGFGVSIASDDRDDVYTAAGDDPNASYVLRLEAEARAAYTDALSNTANGCAAVSSAEVTEQTREFMMSLPPALRDLIDHYNLGTDPDLRHAEADWAQCMTAAGFGWSTRSEMLNDINANAEQGGEAAQQLERSAAVADWDCAMANIEPVRLAKRQEIVDAAVGVEPPEWLEVQ